ncbi:hypothetical protein Pla175_06800 [Pirellulimonas nuda]|uniref:Uncharacterized protein n=1 Tax=Pirellulimonas nuda TaxID=2528009 RepID=A0A518D786_9BACT|nr:hypothetical protein [Pirellulimonas nuda]QDU87321.1 hypothetical protein Pla175_06800 [Pirellulimonas nuda]
MPGAQELNPFEPPQTAPPALRLDPHRPIGIVGWIVIVPLTLLAAALTFCCSCLTLTISTMDLVRGPAADAVFWSAWVVAGAIGIAVGYFVSRGLVRLAKHLRGRIEGADSRRS